jgi:hypothetical protein
MTLWLAKNPVELKNKIKRLSKSEVREPGTRWDNVSL